LYMYSDPGFNEQIKKDQEYWRQAHPVDQAYAEAIQRNPKLARESVGAQAQGAQQAIGEPLAQAAIPGMNALADLFRTIGATASAHPGWVVGAGKLFLSMETFAALPFVSIAVGINALGGAIDALARKLGLGPAIDAGKNLLQKPPGPLDFGGSSIGPTPGSAPKMHLNSYIAPQDSKPITLTATLQVDSAAMARTVEDHIAQAHEMPDSPDTANGVAYLGQNSWNPGIG
jgi:hypothetical protein